MFVFRCLYSTSVFLYSVVTVCEIKCVQLHSVASASMPQSDECLSAGGEMRSYVINGRTEFNCE